MSKRTDAIRNMFAGQNAPQTAAQRPALPRVTAGPVRTMRDTFSDAEREYEALREQLADGLVPTELDPELIDPSPFADRFEEQDAQAYQALKLSIAERGQEIPVLVRPHKDKPDRYQSAYGHRRVRVARELGIKIKAYVRALSDEGLVVAQGIENSAREDPSFIERAFFAVKLEDAGFSRSIVQTALSIDRAEVSKLISVARALPRDIVEAIGRAAKIGRGRWQALAEAVGETGALDRVRSALATEAFQSAASEDRFIRALSAASKSAAKALKTQPETIKTKNGAVIGRLALTDTQWRLSIKRGEAEGFAEFVAQRIPDLFEAFEASRTGDETPDQQ